MAGGKQSDRAQRVDHGGDFIQLPRAILRSAAYRSLDMRARNALEALLERFTGYNNGRIGLCIDDLGTFLGNQNHGANSRALAQLIECGLVECMADANHVKSKAREYRLTFIESGKGGAHRATNEWKTFKPAPAPARVYGNLKNSGAADTATRKRKPVEDTATQRKPRVDDAATLLTETCGVEDRFHVEDTTAHIVSHSLPRSGDGGDGGSFLPVNELRETVNGLIHEGATTAAAIAKAISLPTGTMSKFRNGRNLPAAYHGSLHLELARLGFLGFAKTSAKVNPTPWLHESGWSIWPLAKLRERLGEDACWMPENRGATPDQVSLRRSAMAYMSKSAPGVQARVATSANIPLDVLTDFLTGSALPDRHLASLRRCIAVAQRPPITLEGA